MTTPFLCNSRENILLQVISQLCYALTGTDEEDYKRAFRVHTKQLQALGDVSFQCILNFAAWKPLKHHLANLKHEEFESIFEYASEIHAKAITPETLPAFIASQYNNQLIAKCMVAKSNCHVFLNRQTFIPLILKSILNGEILPYKLNHNILVTSNPHDVISITDLRVKILKEIIENFNAKSSNENSPLELHLTIKSTDAKPNKILCGCVLNEKGQKEEDLKANDLYNEYASNMRMMFEHRYGVRNITSNPGWKEKIDKLGHAAVTFHMIQNTPQKTISLASKHHVIKDAAFVIYNGARIRSILRRFHAEVEQLIHPALPQLVDIDFALLKHDEEWELIFVFLAQYPILVENLMKDLVAVRLNIHKIYEFLVQFSTAFSVYYSRIKIITESKEHLVPGLHARIYLLQAIDVILMSALEFLNIEAVNEM